MDCLNCSRISFSKNKCPFCSNNLCSYICLETHLISNHPNNNNSKCNIYEKPKIIRIKKKQPNIKNITSPYLTYGFIAKNILYDKTYELNNFIPEMDNNNKPIIIGTGSYGKVLLFRNIRDNELYAIKHMDKKYLNKSLKNMTGIYNEIFYQSRIFHQNIVRLLYVKETTQSFNLIMEYAKGGNLFYYIRDKKHLSEKESFKYFSQIINAVYFLHKNDLIHRDIKPENILLYDNGVCKLCDFGWCVKLDGKQRSTFCGTMEYMSPEIINQIEYSKEIDIWSLGILLYEMIHGYSPFKADKDNCNAKEVIDKIKMHKIKFYINISKECRELICHLLDEKAENRYKIEDIFNSNFIKKYENKQLFFPKKDNVYIKENNSIFKTSSSIKEKNDKNKYFCSGSPYKKIMKNSNSFNLFPSFLKNASLINRSNNAVKKLDKYNTSYNEDQLPILSKNKVNDLSNLSISYEDKYKEKNENIFNSEISIFSKNKKINLSEHKNRINFNNTKSKDVISKSQNHKNGHKNNVKNSNNNIIKNNRKNVIKPLNIFCINNTNYTNNEENNKNICITSRLDNTIYKNNNLIKNKRKINITNFENYNKKKNIKEKKNNDKEYMNLKPFATVKKLSNETNIKDKSIINYNNYFITYRGNISKCKKYEKITIYNDFEPQSFTQRDTNGPKDNIKKKNKYEINDINTTHNNINSKQKINKRKIADSLKINKIKKIINKDKDFINPPLFNGNFLKSQIIQPINDNFNNTYRDKKYNSPLNTNFNQTELNSEYNTYNQKASLTLPANHSYNTKIKQKSESKQNLDKSNKSYNSHSKPKFILNAKLFSIINKKKENNIKLFRNQNLDLNLINKRKKYETSNNNDNTNTPRFNTQRENYNKKIKNFNSFFNEIETKLMNNKQYIKMNDLTKYSKSNNKDKDKSKTKNEIIDINNINNIFSCTEEDIEKSIHDKFDKQRSIKPKLISNEKKNYLYLKKINHKIDINKFINNNEEFNNINYKNIYTNPFSERAVNKSLVLKNELKENNEMNLFSDRVMSKKTKKMEELQELQKTPKKSEDKIKIIPSELINNFSLEFNLFKNKLIQ